VLLLYSLVARLLLFEFISLLVNIFIESMNYARNKLFQEHNYSMPSAQELKARLDKAEDHRVDLERQLRNSRAREKRARVSCVNLLHDLREMKLMTEELESKLEAYSGKYVLNDEKDV